MHFYSMLSSRPRWLRNPRGKSIVKQPLGQDVVNIFHHYVFHQLPIRLLSIIDRGKGRVRFQLIKRDDLKAEDYITEKAIASRLSESVSREKVIRELVEQKLRYAIFSHRWLPVGEPTFEMVQEAGLADSGTHASPGFKKLVNFCTVAVENGCWLAWADTVCIDKRSSAELEQAIRSMFNWYRSSHVCIVHLAKSSEMAEIEKDPWFTRGWTLQELLAPVRIKFYTKDWKPFASIADFPDDKDNDEIRRAVSKTTGIRDYDLCHFSPGLLNVREKMVWASKRQTTLEEDVAYSLLGIFDISMPITYGEGKRAFRRLMEVIVQDCREWQIFAWAGRHSPYAMAFPESPCGYGGEFLGQVDPYVLDPQRPIHRPWDLGYPFYTMKKSGLEIKVLLVEMMLQIDRKEEPKAGQHCERLTFRPALQDRGYFNDIEAVCDSRFLLYSEWAVGVISYQTEGNGEMDKTGELEANKNYVCFLFGRGIYSPYTKWEKVGTMKVLTICTKEVVRKELKTVWL
ncbi:hypothetical protein L210DRAFT_3506209 [Boletus edulis BED1]|uniref:Heterokaryon incompatibility domain-containing protein n=1 Tax=Boletus edulis BED1 TaxID=1328754 RepID=A0AAD4GBW6_BOLED|nr:hypothetical protein L210DRAFT_3506209 [Boletus edulis BED1]